MGGNGFAASVVARLAGLLRCAQANARQRRKSSTR